MHVRDDFPVIKNNPEIIYFDSGATTLKPKCVIDTVNEFYTTSTSNIHRGDYDISFNVSKKYDGVRDKTAKFLNANRKEEIVFTSGSTRTKALFSWAISQISLIGLI